MIKHRNRLAITLVAASLFAAPVAAQGYDGSVGYGGGIIGFTDFNSGGDGAAFALDPGWVVNGHIEHWMDRGRIGGRINAAFTQRPMETQSDVRSIRTWIVGGDLLLRVRPASGPFVGIGAGMVHYGFGTGPAVFLPAENARYAGDTDRRFAVSGSVGLDIIPGFTIFDTPAGFRLEAIDHVVLDSPFEPTTGSGSFDPIHNIRVSFSVLGLVRLLR